MSRRIQLMLPDPAAEQLAEEARAAGRPLGTHASQILQAHLAESTDLDRPRPVRRARSRGRSPAAKGAGRPPWLPPHSARRAWRAEMWGAILALHDRYPEQLAPLQDGWWESEAHVERLCALVAWRRQLDTDAADPREELAFHVQLEDYSRSLRQKGGGITRAWTPGAPPTQWGEG